VPILLRSLARTLGCRTVGASEYHRQLQAYQLLSAVAFLASGLLLLAAALLESNSGLKVAADVFAWPGIVMLIPSILFCVDSGVMHD
jgi:uncharacterized membrane protein YjjP (DUF1212 family)